MKSNYYPFIGFLVLLIIFPLSDTEAQNRRLRSRQVSSIDLMGGADFGFRTISIKSRFGASGEKYVNRSKNELPTFNYRFGINYIQGLSERLSLRVGFRKATAGFRTNFIERIDVFEDINDITKVLTSDQNNRTIYVYRYNFIELPVAVRHTMVKSFCEPYVEFGVSTYFYNHTVVKSKFYSRVDGKRGLQNTSTIRNGIEENINQFNYLPFISAGGNFRITKTFTGFSQFIYRHQFNKLRNEELAERIVSLGCEIGIKYYLEVY